MSSIIPTPYPSTLGGNTARYESATQTGGKRNRRNKRNGNKSLRRGNKSLRRGNKSLRRGNKSLRRGRQ